MGAETFSKFKAGANRAIAFQEAVEADCLDYGRLGYTGSLAEKDEFEFCGSASTLSEARDMAEKMFDDGDERIDDKWGPAGCIDVLEPKGFLFFGWASS